LIVKIVDTLRKCWLTSVDDEQKINELLIRLMHRGLINVSSLRV